jgi:hypothetical protein
MQKSRDAVSLIVKTFRYKDLKKHTFFKLRRPSVFVF